MSAKIDKKFGTIATRMDALKALLEITDRCACERCFHLAAAARQRIAILESWTANV